ncbi:MAG TPA: hypothetical protein VHO90_06415 [Bacteroidales bacterium]|nr:hypothetical protein [Bacteroidales bacterium]
MSDSDYIPHTELEFNIWQENVVRLVEANATLWAIATDPITDVKVYQTKWVSAFTKASRTQDRTTADVRAKNEARDAYEKRMRSFVGEYLTNNSKITNADRDRLGITVKSGIRIPVGIPPTAPEGRVDFSVRLQHTIHFKDEGAENKAKPAGVHGCEIWMRIGGADPASYEGFTYLATDTKSPYVISFEPADIGKMVYYRLRWVNKRGQPGPWSKIFSAIVAA